MKVLGCIALILVLFWLVSSFFIACYGWLVVAFPSFEVFPRWAFVLLLYMLAMGSK